MGQSRHIVLEMAPDLVVYNCNIVTPYERIGPDVGIAVEDEKITALGRPAQLPDAPNSMDLNGNFLVPGLIDCHVHTRSPGDEYKEDWESVTRAAAVGGLTTLIAMPNTDPMIDTPEHAELIYDLASENAIVDYQSYAVVTSDNLDQIHPLDEAGIAGYKVFLGTTFGEIEPPNDGELHEVMGEIAKTGKRLGFHEENDAILSHYTDQFKAAGRNRPIDHARSRPVIAEAEAVSRTTLLAKDTGCPVHMFHVSSGTAAEIVAKRKDEGVNATAETMPHYLWFTEDVMKEKGNEARVQPPIRDQAEQDRLWDQLGDGIDCIATDHAPHTHEEKGLDDPFKNTWESISGFTGLEAELAAMHTFVKQDRLPLEKWVYMHTTRPAEIWGMYPQKGSLKIGTDADFTVIDPDQEWTLDREAQQSKSKASPFDGESFVGKAVATIVRGNVVYHNGTITGIPGEGERVEVSSTIDASH